MNALAEYYQNLYKNYDSDENGESLQECFGNKIILTLSEHSKIMREGMLLWEGCFEVLKRFPHSKASSNDGPIPLFYTCNLTFDVLVRIFISCHLV